MFTPGSKLLIGSAFAAWVFAAVYGIAQGGTLGSLGLISAAAGLSLLAGLNVFVRDSNVSATDHESFESAAAAQATARPSLWPLLVALGATTVTLGLATYQAIFMLGMVAILAGTIEWLVQGWSERASADRSYNAQARDALVDPLEIPVAGAIGFGVVVFAFSRVMLGLPSKTSTVVAFSVVAALVLAVGALIGFRRTIPRSTLTGAFSIVAIALVAAGAIAGLNGERKTHVIETTADLAEENLCGTEETEADEKASQTVAIKSDVWAEITFDGTSLESEVPGFQGDFDALTITRANPTNVFFRNEAEKPALLVLELHPEVDDDGEPLGPERVCTALVEEGGVQIMSFKIERPSREP